MTVLHLLPAAAERDADPRPHLRVVPARPRRDWRLGAALTATAAVAAGVAVTVAHDGARDGITSPAEASASVQRVGHDGHACDHPGAVNAGWGGTGFAIAPGYAMTAAHVVVDAVRPTFDDRPATVVLYDGRADLAVLHVPGLALPPLGFARDVGKGDTVTVAGFGGRPKLREAKLKGFQDGWPAVGDVLVPGDSGGPWLTKGGKVAGVSDQIRWRESLLDRLLGREPGKTGVAIAADVAADVAAAGIGLTAPAQVPGCAP